MGRKKKEKIEEVEAVETVEEEAAAEASESDVEELEAAAEETPDETAEAMEAEADEEKAEAKEAEAEEESPAPKRRRSPKAKEATPEAYAKAMKQILADSEKHWEKIQKIQEEIGKQLQQSHQVFQQMPIVDLAKTQQMKNQSGQKLVFFASVFALLLSIVSLSLAQSTRLSVFEVKQNQAIAATPKAEEIAALPILKQRSKKR